MAEYSAYMGTVIDTWVVFSKKYSICAHSAIIRENSKVLAPLLTETVRSEALKRRQKIPGETIRYRMDLVRVDGKLGFATKTVNKIGLTPPLNSDNDDHVEERLLQALKAVFELWYNRPQSYGRSIEEILQQGLYLCKAGVILGSSAATNESFERALLKISRSIWPLIAQNPVEWLILSYTIQSREIFKEALIHTIGKWKLLHLHERERAGEIESLRDIILVKLILEQQRKERKEDAVIAYYPAVLQSMIRTDRPTDPPAKNEFRVYIFEWMALSFFRQWVAQMLRKHVGHLAPDGGYALYSAMSKGGEHYLKRGELEQFFRLFPMSDKAKNIIFNAINLIKEGVKTIVTPLMENRAEFSAVQYLTSCPVDEDDYVWLQPVDEESKTRVREWVRCFPDFEFWAPPAGGGFPTEPRLMDLLGRACNDQQGNELETLETP